MKGGPAGSTKKDHLGPGSFGLEHKPPGPKSAGVGSGVPSGDDVSEILHFCWISCDIQSYFGKILKEK